MNKILVGPANLYTAFLSLLATALLLAAPVGAQQPPGASVTADTAGAIGLITGYVAAWNVHDVNALSSLFSENAAFVNPMGNWASGRENIEAEHKKRHGTIFQTSTMTADTVRVKFISPDIAVTHFQWTITGWLQPNGTPGEPFSGITSFVSKRDEGRWQIESGHVTVIAAEGTLPTGSVRGNR